MPKLPDVMIAYAKAVGLGVVDVLSSDARIRSRFEKAAKGKITRVGKQYHVRPEDIEIVADVLKSIYKNVMVAREAQAASRGGHESTHLTPYSTLGLTPTASNEVVAAAYKALAMKHHPDRGAMRG